MIVPLPREMFRFVTKTICAPVALLALFLCLPGHSYAATDVLTIPMEDTREASWNLEADKLVTLSDIPSLRRRVGLSFSGETTF